jgi:hypothetical protein
VRNNDGKNFDKIFLNGTNPMRTRLAEGGVGCSRSLKWKIGNGKFAMVRHAKLMLAYVCGGVHGRHDADVLRRNFWMRGCESGKNWEQRQKIAKLFAPNEKNFLPHLQSITWLEVLNVEEKFGEWKNLLYLCAVISSLLRWQYHAQRCTKLWASRSEKMMVEARQRGRQWQRGRQ